MGKTGRHYIVSESTGYNSNVDRGTLTPQLTKTWAVWAKYNWYSNDPIRNDEPKRPSGEFRFFSTYGTTMYSIRVELVLFVYSQFNKFIEFY